AARCEVQTLDLDECRVRVGDVPADDGMARALQRTREVEPHRLGDRLEVAAFGQALHAVNANPGQVVTGLGDEGVAVCRLRVAEGLQWLPERKRQSGKS